MEPSIITSDDTIAAIATPYGSGGLAVIRVSGPRAFDIVSGMWKGKDIASCASHTAHLGSLTQNDGSVLDQAVLTLFRAPNSFTGQDTVELSLHGSKWIQREAMNRLVELGARPAGPGEFSQRAFLNGRMDLAQTEAVADLISASSKAAHHLAMQQLSGSFSNKLNQLRDKLIEFASLLELELDFSEEDVEFADRAKMINVAEETLATIRRLADSYSRGQAFLEGFPVGIAGAPNAGKSTLLNRLLDSDKAIVTDIPGTTRDIIEDTREIDGVLFRFIDTAGLRETDDTVERMGIERAKERISHAAIILWMVDAAMPVPPQIDELLPYLRQLPDVRHIILLNKSDITGTSAVADTAHTSIAGETALASAAGNSTLEFLPISAKTGQGMDQLTELLLQVVQGGYDSSSDLIVTNARHYEALRSGAAALDRAIQGLRELIPGDLVAQDVREALHHLGTVTGAVTPADLLTSIFSRFCIGK